MLKVGLFLHAYQPSTQFPDLVTIINNQSYKPLLSLLEDHPGAKITANLAGSLLDFWGTAQGVEIIDRWKKLIDRGQVEIVGSAKYHPLLPKLPQSEMTRQITLQEESVKQYLVPDFKPRGFYPPEMAFSHEVAEAVSAQNYTWIILDKSADPTSEANFPARQTVPTIIDHPLKVFFRNSFLSQEIAFARINSISEFIGALGTVIGGDYYLILAMDAETFGWHRPGQVGFLRDLFSLNQDGSGGYKLLTLSEIADIFPVGQKEEPFVSTWGETLQGKDGQKIFPRWDNPNDPLHRFQWELFDLALSLGTNQPEGSDSRLALDKAVQSDQFWWASGNPCWHPQMVEMGLALLQKVVLTSSSVSPSDKEKALNLAKMIIETGKAKFGEQAIAC